MLIHFCRFCVFFSNFTYSYHFYVYLSYSFFFFFFFFFFFLLLLVFLSLFVIFIMYISNMPPPPVGALNRCHLSNWRFNPETVHFSSSKRPFLPTMFVSKCYKQSILAKILFFTRSQNLEGKITIFTVLKWGKGRNHYENHDLGHNHWKRSATRPKMNPFWTQNAHGFQARTPIWQMAPISRIYPPPKKPKKLKHRFVLTEQKTGPGLGPCPENVALC